MKQRKLHPVSLGSAIVVTVLLLYLSFATFQLYRQYDFAPQLPKPGMPEEETLHLIKQARQSSSALNHHPLFISWFGNKAPNPLEVARGCTNQQLHSRGMTNRDCFEEILPVIEQELIRNNEGAVYTFQHSLVLICLLLPGLLFLILARRPHLLWMGCAAVLAFTLMTLPYGFVSGAPLKAVFLLLVWIFSLLAALNPWLLKPTRKRPTDLVPLINIFAGTAVMLLGLLIRVLEPSRQESVFAYPLLILGFLWLIHGLRQNQRA